MDKEQLQAKRQLYALGTEIQRQYGCHAAVSIPYPFPALPINHIEELAKLLGKFGVGEDRALAIAQQLRAEIGGIAIAIWLYVANTKKLSEKPS